MNLNNISNFLLKDSGYIIVVDRHGHISEAERCSFFTFFGRAFAWLTGRSYDLKKVVEMVRNTSVFQTQEYKQALQLITKLNKKIDSYNLKHPKNQVEKINNLFTSVTQGQANNGLRDGTKSFENLADPLSTTEKAAVPETPGANFSAGGGDLTWANPATEQHIPVNISRNMAEHLDQNESKDPLSPTPIISTLSTFSKNDLIIETQAKEKEKNQNQIFHHNFEETLAEARENHKAVASEGIKFCLLRENDCIYAQFSEDQDVMYFSPIFKLYSFKEVKFENNLFLKVNLPSIYYLFALSTELKVPFFHLSLLIGGDRHSGLSHLIEQNMNPSTATIFHLSNCRDFCKLPQLDKQEEQLLMEACKFLTYASRAVESAEECVLSLESLCGIMTLIEKITVLFKEQNVEEEILNTIFLFSKIMNELEAALPPGIKSANKV